MRQSEEKKRKAAISVAAPCTTSSKRTSASSKALMVCDVVLRDLVRHPHAGPFLAAVSRKEAPDYYDIIKHPMDLAKVSDKLRNVQV